jgi:hypothetical protein
MITRLDVICGQFALEVLGEEEVMRMVAAHEATRTPAIEARKQELLDTYSPILGDYAIRVIEGYKQGILLEDLLDELENEARCIQEDLVSLR